jgi:ADP-ribose pyrophosphatase YjhB (NUDIX family)
MVTIDIVLTGPTSRVLLLRRSDMNVAWKGLWATPGGRVYRNERLSEAIQRIALRETGIRLLKGQVSFAGVKEIITGKEHAVTNVFKAHASTSSFRLDGTSTEAQWFRPVELPPSLRQEYRDMLSMCGIRGFKGKG